MTHGHDHPASAKIKVISQSVQKTVETNGRTDVRRRLQYCSIYANLGATTYPMGPWDLENLGTEYIWFHPTFVTVILSVGSMCNFRGTFKIFLTMRAPEFKERRMGAERQWEQKRW